MLTLDAFEQCLKDCFPQGLNGKKTAVALSGGLDSVVLLHLLVCAGKRAGFVPEALHIHHGLSPRADDWADFCRNYCDMLGVGLETVKVCVEKTVWASRRRQGKSVMPSLPKKALTFWRWRTTGTIKSKPLCWQSRAAEVCALWRLCPPSALWGKRHYLATLLPFFAPRHMGLCPKTRFAEYRG